MAGGSTHPETPHDGQCSKCGLYYRDVGPTLTLHEASCTGQPRDDPDDLERPQDVEEIADTLAGEGYEVVDRYGTIAEPEPPADPVRSVGGLPTQEPEPQEPEADPYICPNCSHNELYDLTHRRDVDADVYCPGCDSYFNDE